MIFLRYQELPEATGVSRMASAFKDALRSGTWGRKCGFQSVLSGALDVYVQSALHTGGQGSWWQRGDDA